MDTLLEHDENTKDLPGQEWCDTHVHHPEILHAEDLEILIDASSRFVGLAHLHRPAGVPHADCGLPDICLCVNISGRSSNLRNPIHWRGSG